MDTFLKFFDAFSAVFGLIALIVLSVLSRAPKDPIEEMLGYDSRTLAATLPALVVAMCLTWILVRLW